MPSMANITVKKNDGITDIVYTSKSPSAGNGVPAVWRADAVGTAASHRPELRMTAKDIRLAGEDAREIHATFAFPQLVTDANLGGMTVIKRKAMGSYTGKIPKEFPAVDQNEFASQFANLIVSTLFKDCVKDGFAPT